MGTTVNSNFKINKYINKKRSTKLCELLHGCQVVKANVLTLNTIRHSSKHVEVMAEKAYWNVGEFGFLTCLLI
jgi:hypothetical protein